jgi:hypothetical protein
MQEKPGSPGFSYLAGYPCVNVFASGVRERPVRFKKKKKNILATEHFQCSKQVILTKNRTGYFALETGVSLHTFS